MCAYAVPTHDWAPTHMVPVFSAFLASLAMLLLFNTRVAVTMFVCVRVCGGCFKSAWACRCIVCLVMCIAQCLSIVVCVAVMSV